MYNLIVHNWPVNLDLRNRYWTNWTITTCRARFFKIVDKISRLLLCTNVQKKIESIPQASSPLRQIFVPDNDFRHYLNFLCLVAFHARTSCFQGALLSFRISLFTSEKSNWKRSLAFSLYAVIELLYNSNTSINFNSANVWVLD